MRVAHSLFLLRHKGELLPPHHPARGVRRIRCRPRHRHQQSVQQFVGHPRRPEHFQPCKPSVQVGRRGFAERCQRSSISVLVQLGRFVAYDPEAPPDISDFITVTLGRGGGGPHTEAAARCRESLVELGFDAPEWGDLARGLRPDFDPAADQFTSLSRNGWQQKASDVVENDFLARSIWPTLAHPEQALLRSQQGPMAGLPFTSSPLSAETTFQSQEFRVLFLRRLWQPLPLSSFTCRCGRPLDSRFHHRAACPLAGVLGRRGFALESAAARVCREAGGRVTTNVLVQDMDLLPPPSGGQPQAGSRRRWPPTVQGSTTGH